MRDSTFLGAFFAIAGLSTPLVVLWLRRRALRRPIAAHRAATALERDDLRRRGRMSVVYFVAVLSVALGLILGTAMLGAGPFIERSVLLVVLVLVVGGVTHHLRTRCPICDYRLGYQRSLGVPARCERCGADL